MENKRSSDSVEVNQQKYRRVDTQTTSNGSSDNSTAVRVPVIVSPGGITQEPDMIAANVSFDQNAADDDDTALFKALISAQPPPDLASEENPQNPGSHQFGIGTLVLFKF